MGNEDKILFMMEKLHIELQAVKQDMATKEELQKLATDIQKLREQVARIENTHGEKLGALFDGYKLVSEKLDRIEQEVSKHEEVILRRIR
ncbi:MAG TPA: hypothetical protein GXZ96_07405 [Firmicutes bacterium]|jgi:flagellin-like hook-associated protein FlgL|nr:hypothetical protein [Bacillota bacterium]